MRPYERRGVCRGLACAAQPERYGGSKHTEWPIKYDATLRGSCPSLSFGASPHNP